MSTKIEATIDDLLHVPGKAELVGGEIVMMSPTGSAPNQAAGKIYARLLEYTERTGRGEAVTDNTAFVVNLPHRQSFSPDAAYFEGAVSMKFVTGAPMFAVEVRSEGDYGPKAEQEIAEKLADYFAAGTLVVWDVDLQSEDVVKVYRSTAPTEPIIYRRGELAEAEPAVPGWTIPVDYLFARKMQR
jgi:Uma2 family endonuclease